jgi:hypothetical protein
MNRACLAFSAAVAAPAVLADAAQDRLDVAHRLVASVAARTLVSVSIDECTARFAPLVEPALDAKMEWDARNAPFEERARMLANRLATGVDAATGASGYEAFRKSLLAQAQAEAASKVRETVTRNLTTKPAAESIGLCRDLVRAVHEGKMDFAVTQPRAYRLIEGK